MGHPVDISDDSFKQEILESDQPVLVDFWAE
jgi:thioredoxin-like negative regulator of GroEL